MPNPDFVLRLNDTLEPLTVIARKADGTLIDEDLAGASCKFTLKTWTGAVLLDHVDAVVADVPTKELGFDWGPHVADLEPSPIFYHHKAWFTLHIGTALLSVPNDTYLYIRITSDSV